MHTLIFQRMAKICRVGLAAVVISMWSVEGGRSQQIVPDDTLGTETSVVSDGVVDSNPAQLIEGGATRGGNLFHSFSDFNVGLGESVYFTNPIDIDNIISRITGSSPSTIDGVLGVDGTANLFLLNPNGIVFGPEAQLDIAGSFTASTAESFAFPDGSEFSSVSPGTSLLSVSVPLGIQFNAPSNNRQPQGDLTNEAVLEVGEGRSLNLFGDKVFSNIHLSAPGGNAQVIGNSINLTDSSSSPQSTTSGNTNILFRSIKDITIADSLNNAWQFASGTGQIVVEADANDDGIGDVVMWDLQDKLQTNGRDISISGANFRLGSVDTSLQAQEVTTVIDADFGGQIPSTGTSGSANFTFTVNENISDIEDLDVRFSAAHTWNGDLNVTLTSPDGTSLELFSNVGDDGDNFQDTLFDDEAITSIEFGTSPFIGSFQPEGSEGLSIFNGKSATGIWTLEVVDTVEQDAGRLFLSGELTPWGIAEGTQLLVTPLEEIGGSVNLNASGDIVTNDILFTNGGDISMTSTTGNINILGSLDSGFLENFKVGDGGDIVLSAYGSITIPELEDMNALGISSGLATSYNEAGNGGNIFLTSTVGDITINNSIFSGVTEGLIGNSGEIRIHSTFGDIIVNSADISSRVNYSGEFGLVGSGGDITLSSTFGSVKVNDNSRLHTFSRAEDEGNNGNGGDIHISAFNDVTIEADLSTFSYGGFSRDPDVTTTTGDGGNISITSTNGNVYLNPYVVDMYGRSPDISSIVETYSSASEGPGGNGGNISINAFNNILINTEIDTSTLGFEDFLLGVEESLNPGRYMGNGGAVTIASNSGDITINEGISTSSFVDSGIAQDGGAIKITTGSGDITINEGISTSSFANSGIAQDGGAIKITTGSGDITTNSNLFSFAFSSSGAAGDGGDILLRTENGSIRGVGSQVTSFSVAQDGGETGAGGTVTLEAHDLSELEVLTLSSAGTSGDIQIHGLGDSTTAEQLVLTTTAQIVIPDPTDSDKTLTLNLSNVGQSGNTLVTSKGDIVFDTVTIQSDANGVQAAGNINITSPEQITFRDSQISSNANSSGAAGSILIEAASVSLGERNRISAATSSTGNGGTIRMNATESVSVGEDVEDLAPIISVEASDEGLPGNISINTPDFTLSETARITATATATAETNPERGGSITLSADRMDLAGTVEILAETRGQSPGGLLTLQPYQTNLNANSLPQDSQIDRNFASDIDANPLGNSFRLTLTPGARISASTTSSGNGGGLRLQAPENIMISGRGRLDVETSGAGDAGNIRADARTLTLTDGVTLSASTIRSGDAGNINLNISDQLTIDGSTVESRTENNSTGRGGNINVSGPGQVSLLNGGNFTLNSEGSGKGGDFTLSADTLTLDSGQITTVTQSSNGGDFTFDLGDYLLLRNGSLISTEAGRAGADGNGGRIAINIPNGFIVAVPDENSDIRANAFNGDGGTVNITARNLLGIDFRPDLNDTPASDITSSSEFGNSGTVTIDELNSETLQPESELPVETAPATVARGCRAQGAQTGSFVSTGRGGLPDSPIDPLSAVPLWQDIEPLELSFLPQGTPHSSSTRHESRPDVVLEAGPVVEAQSWTRSSDGSVKLLAQSADAGSVPIVQASVC